MGSTEDVISEFRRAMEADGLTTSEEIIADGKLHRAHADGDSKGSQNLRYVLHLDGLPAGWYKSMKTDVERIWNGKVDRKLTAIERKEHEKKISEQRRLRDEEEKKDRAEAAKRAQEIWDASSSPDSDHPYIIRKNIEAFGTRVSQGAIVVPLRDSDGKICSLQFIWPNGDKRYLSGGRKQGCYFTIGRPDSSRPPIVCICEGFATGASIYEATGYPVAVAFDANNLIVVAAIVRSKFPRAQIILCADNDQWTPGNPGITKATEAAFNVQGLVVWPVFENPEEGKTDFNDLAMIEGHKVVAKQIEKTYSISSSPVTDPGVPSVSLQTEATMCAPAFIDFPHLDRHKPLSTIENVQELLDSYGVRVRYDVIRKDLDISIPHQKYLVDTARNDKITWLISRAGFYKLPVQRLPEFVSHIAGQNPYNPVAEWVTSKAWDGTSRLKEFFDTIQAVNESNDNAIRELKETLMRRWMLSAIAAAFRPNGVSAHGVLTLQGDQYLGKTAWFKSLVPDHLRDVIADGMLLDPKDKDSVYQVVTHWLVELGEIDATFRRSDIAQLKSFITKDRDVLRRPYARAESEFARRTVFFASVNPEDFLADPTGNRRFWTIPCASINFRHGIDMQQLWAEFHALYEKGESWYMTTEELGRLNTHNRDFESSNASEELVITRLNWDEPRTLWKRRTATEIAMMIGFREPNEKILKQVGKAVRDRSGVGRSKHAGRYVYLVPDTIQYIS